MAEGYQHPVPEIAPALAQPGLIVRTSINLGEQDRIIQFEGFIDRDAEQAEIDHLCDKMVRAGDRLKARHMLPIYRRQLEDLEYRHTENRKRLAELEARLKAADEARLEKRTELSTQLAQAISDARDAHLASGRRGEFKPTPQVTQRIDVQISQLDEMQSREHNEAAQTRSTLDNELKEGQRAVDQAKKLIAEYEAMAREAPANEG